MVIFIAKARLSPANKLKARFTIETLKLNRDYLVQARQSAFASYTNSLALYVIEKNKPEIDKQALGRKKAELDTGHHRTVWFEIKRQHHKFDQIAADFQAAPELLSICH